MLPSYGYTGRKKILKLKAPCICRILLTYTRAGGPYGA